MRIKGYGKVRTKLRIFYCIVTYLTLLSLHCILYTALLELYSSALYCMLYHVIISGRV